MDIIIDPEFEKIVPPLSEEEFDQLERNIVEDGVVYEPLVLWNQTIVDGHNRWHIISKHPQIPYTTTHKDFNNRDEAIEWMCKKQLGRRNLNEAQRSMLVGEMYEARVRRGFHPEKGEGGRFQLGQSGQGGSTRQAIAEESGRSERSVGRDTDFYHGMQALGTVAPETKEKILQGKLNPPKVDISSLKDMNEEQLAQAAKQIERGERIRPEYKRTQCATQMEHTHEYDINDFRDELRGKVINLENSLDMTCRLVHSDMLETQEGKDALSDALLQIVGVVQKYKELC